jgi:hypothetical protein
VELVGAYSNLSRTGERLRKLLEMPPEGPAATTPRAARQSQRRLRRPEIDELVAGYLPGSTVYELADGFSIHRHTVSEILERRGVARRYKKLSPEQVDLACALYRGGLSLTKVGVQLERRAETVRQALLKAGIEMRARNGRR